MFAQNLEKNAQISLNRKIIAGIQMIVPFNNWTQKVWISDKSGFGCSVFGWLL